MFAWLERRYGQPILINTNQIVSIQPFEAFSGELLYMVEFSNKEIDEICDIEFEKLKSVLDVKGE